LPLRTQIGSYVRPIVEHEGAVVAFVGTNERQNGLNLLTALVPTFGDQGSSRGEQPFNDGCGEHCRSRAVATNAHAEPRVH